MVSMSNKAGTGGLRRKRTKGPFRGVRMRKWGRWVSEIRIPNSKSRIWLGSYDTPEKAARAYDAALYCLRGSKGKFNFPDDKHPEIPNGSSVPLSKTDIKAVAAGFASSSCMSVQASTSSFTTLTSLPEGPVTTTTETGSTCKVADSVFAAGVSEPDTFSPESFLLDDPFMFEPDCIWDILEENTNFEDEK